MIPVHMDDKSYKNKPNGKEIAYISSRITKNIKEMYLKDFASMVGAQGHAFTRAIFKEGYKNRAAKNFMSQRMLVLDIDEGLTYKGFIERCNRYGLYPFLTYKSLSASENNEKYRALFLNNCEITDPNIALFMNRMLCEIFPESDSKCSDLARMFLGGKEIIDYNESNRVNLLDLARAYQVYKREADEKNCARNIRQFAKNNGVACEKGMLCIYDRTKTDRELPEKYSQLGDAIIETCDKDDVIKGDGKKDGCAAHDYGKANLPILQIDRNQLEKSCALLKEFKNKDIDHGLKFLLATNLVYIKGGKSIFFHCLKKNEQKWRVDWNLIKNYHYFPQQCANAGCPYVDKCGAKTLYGKVSKKIIKIGRNEEYIDLETAQEKLKEYMQEAMMEKGNGIHLIKAQTALGKTELYCNLAAQNPNIPFMFVVPTIKLQNEVRCKLGKKGVGKDFIVHKLVWDDKVIESLRQIEGDFWYDHVKKGILPVPDGSDVSDQMIREVFGKAETGKNIVLSGFTEKLQRREELTALIGKMDVEKKQIEQELKNFLGDAERAEGEGFRVSWTNVVTNRMDNERLKAEQPELYAKYLKPVNSRRLTIKAA